VNHGPIAAAAKSPYPELAMRSPLVAALAALVKGFPAQDRLKRLARLFYVLTQVKD